MNINQVVLPRAASNGYGQRKSEREATSKFDSKFQAGKIISSRTSFGKGGGLESPSFDRLIFLTACLIGHHVEVQVLDGSIFSGIFHATNTDDFGIVLRMARLMKDCSRGQKNISDSPSKPPSRTLIIPAKDLVQLIAKGVSLTRDGWTDELQHEEKQELMTDSCISQSHRVEVGRELERWVPDENDLGCPELDNIFDGPWNRGWDQFEANETLFGVKSTFNEELYTTKLARGPQLRELERRAAKIAREIEGEETFDVHLAEERGIQLDGNLDIDEETRFSSVYRGVDDCDYEEIEDTLLDSQNAETFGDISGSVMAKPLTLMSTGKASDGTQVSSRSSLMGDIQSSVSASRTDVYHSSLEDRARQLLVEQLPKHTSEIARRIDDNQFTRHGETNYAKDDTEHREIPDQIQLSKSKDSLPRLKKENYADARLSPNATAFDPLHASSKGQESTSFSTDLSESVVTSISQGTKPSSARPSSSAASQCLEKISSSNELSKGIVPPKVQGTPSAPSQPSSSASSTSSRTGSSSTSAGRAPSSSIGSFSSERSMLNPHAKEFKFNPNAKSFTPQQPPLRMSSPIADGHFYHPTNMTAVTHIHGMPVGIGLGPSFALQQPVIYNTQAATPVPQPHSFYHPNGPQYGQQMIIGQPPAVLYMPAHPPEMMYKGREF